MLSVLRLFSRSVASWGLALAHPRGWFIEPALEFCHIADWALVLLIVFSENLFEFKNWDLLLMKHIQCIPQLCCSLISCQVESLPAFLSSPWAWSSGDFLFHFLHLNFLLTDEVDFSVMVAKSYP